MAAKPVVPKRSGAMESPTHAVERSTLHGYALKNYSLQAFLMVPYLLSVSFNVSYTCLRKAVASVSVMPTVGIGVCTMMRDRPGRTRNRLCFVSGNKRQLSR